MKNVKINLKSVLIFGSILVSTAAWASNEEKYQCKISVKNPMATHPDIEETINIGKAMIQSGDIELSDERYHVIHSKQTYLYYNAMYKEGSSPTTGFLTLEIRSCIDKNRENETALSLPLTLVGEYSGELKLGTYSVRYDCKIIPQSDEN